MPGWGWALIAIGGLFFLILMAVLGQFISLYVQAWLSNAKVGMLELVGMRLRRVDIRTIVINRIRGAKAGLGRGLVAPDEGLGPDLDAELGPHRGREGGGLADCPGVRPSNGAGVGVAAPIHHVWSDGASRPAHRAPGRLKIRRNREPGPLRTAHKTWGTDPPS